MTIAAISIVRNEEDIIEPFVRHNAAHVDFFLICDHASTDATQSILHRLRAEGYPIFLYRVHGEAFLQGRWMTILAHEAKALVPRLRYVAPLDADEFIFSRQGTLEQALEKHFRRYGDPVCFLPWVTHAPMPTDDMTVKNPAQRIRHRLAREPEPYSKIILPARSIRFYLNIGAGSHGATHLRHKLRGSSLRDVELCHFPVRAVDQVRRKVTEGSIASREIQKRRPDVGSHWNQLKAQFEAESPAMQDVTEIARRYIGGERPEDIDIVASEFRYMGDKPAPAGQSRQLRYGDYANHPRLVSMLRGWPGPEDPARKFEPGPVPA
ncbi:MAG: glycosyltransferase family 2 protein [Gammaproteobacteria bacterium]